MMVMLCVCGLRDWLVRGSFGVVIVVVIWSAGLFASAVNVWRSGDGWRCVCFGAPPSSCVVAVAVAAPCALVRLCYFRSLLLHCSSCSCSCSCSCRVRVPANRYGQPVHDPSHPKATLLDHFELMAVVDWSGKPVVNGGRRPLPAARGYSQVGWSAWLAWLLVGRLAWLVS
jgi:hypothetical protein